MADRPIPFKGAMVRAILDGTKTQTRRVLKPDGKYRLDLVAPADGGPARCPYGQPGDRLWVREAWKAHSTFDHLPPRDILPTHVWYMADDGYKPESRYRQAFHMPRWASRITLEITGVRVERLQDISYDDAHDEGTAQWAAETCRDGNKWPNIVRAYQGLWESINGPGSWGENPWVWVVEFRRLP